MLRLHRDEPRVNTFISRKYSATINNRLHVSISCSSTPEIGSPLLSRSPVLMLFHLHISFYSFLSYCPFQQKLYPSFLLFLTTFLLFASNLAVVFKPQMLPFPSQRPILPEWECCPCRYNTSDSVVISILHLHMDTVP